MPPFSKAMSTWYQNVPWDVGGKNLPTWIKLLEEQHCGQANLTHHLQGTAEAALLRTIPNSLRWNIHLSSRNLADVSLETFLDQVQALPNVQELLVVSGNPMPKRSSFDLLDSLSEFDLPYPLATAVSPSDTVERISRKCNYRAVSRIYLQLAEIEQWEPLLHTIRLVRKDLTVSACWLPPTPTNWTALKLFPWKGAVLSAAWQHSFAYAQECAQLQLDWMWRNGVTPLIEPRRITKDLLSTLGMYHI